MRHLLVTLALLAAAAPAPPAAAAPRSTPIPVRPGIAEHTQTAFTVMRDGVVERDERVETWVSARRAKVVYSDAQTGRVLGACTATRLRIHCYDRDPKLEAPPPGDGGLFLDSWAESGRAIRRAVARGYLAQTETTQHRGTPARRLVSTPAATGDAGTTTVLAESETFSVLFRQTSGPAGEGTITSTEDVLVRERLPARHVDFRLHAPEGKRVRTRWVGPRGRRPR